MTFKLLCACFLAASLGASCGKARVDDSGSPNDSVPSDPTPVTEQPASTPVTPPSTGSSQPPSAPSWYLITEQLSLCDTPQCAGFEGFSIRSGGSFYSAADHQPGVLTEDEVHQLSDAVTPVLAHNAAGTPACTLHFPAPGTAERALTVIPSGANTAPLVVYDNTKLLQVCVLGGGGEAESLLGVMDGLTKKYATVGKASAPQ